MRVVELSGDHAKSSVGNLCHLSTASGALLDHSQYHHFVYVLNEPIAVTLLSAFLGLINVRELTTGYTYSPQHIVQPVYLCSLYPAVSRKSDAWALLAKVR